MSEVTCPKCMGDLKLDLKKCRTEGLPIYSCDCGVYGYFKVLDIELGRKTKDKLENKKFVDSIPF